MRHLHFKFRGIHIVSKTLTSIFSFNYAYAITIFPFVFYRTRHGRSNIITRTHETIHIFQQMECGLAGIIVYLIGSLSTGNWFVFLPAIFSFYLLYAWYFIAYFIKLKNWDKAYKAIPFEEEAYLKSNSVLYLRTRRFFAWIHY